LNFELTEKIPNFKGFEVDKRRSCYVKDRSGCETGRGGAISVTVRTGLYHNLAPR